MQDLAGKVAFITGAASGIGLGIARAALAEGMQVMLADIEAGALEAACAALDADHAATVVCDVADRASLQAARDATLERFGKVHLVCNNAGVSTGAFMDACDDGDWMWSIGVNYLGVVYGCETFIPVFKQQREGGHIVNTSSMAGLLGGMAGWGPYNSTKFAVVGLTEVVRQEGRDGGFGASVLCPGGVNTNIFDAPRNRQEKFGPQVSSVAVMEDLDVIKEGLDPNIVGRLVLEGVQANRLYIFTDPRFQKLVRGRFERIQQDFDWAADSRALTDAGAPGAN